MSEEEPAPEVWLIDGFNVLHAGVLRGRDRAGWWKVERQEKLIERVDLFEDATVELWVVFDAARPDSERCEEPEAPSRIRVFFAASADDWLVAAVKAEPEPNRFCVVSADQQVVGRCNHNGARTLSPRKFLARCPE